MTVVYMPIIVIKILTTHVQETVCHRFLWKFRIEIIQFILLVKELYKYLAYSNKCVRIPL